MASVKPFKQENQRSYPYKKTRNTFEQQQQTTTTEHQFLNKDRFKQMQRVQVDQSPYQGVQLTNNLIYDKHNNIIVFKAKKTNFENPIPSYFLTRCRMFEHFFGSIPGKLHTNDVHGVLIFNTAKYLNQLLTYKRN